MDTDSYPDPDPDSAKLCRSDRIRIHNADFSFRGPSGALNEQKKSQTAVVLCYLLAFSSYENENLGTALRLDMEIGEQAPSFVPVVDAIMPVPTQGRRTDYLTIDYLTIDYITIDYLTTSFRFSHSAGINVTPFWFIRHVENIFILYLFSPYYQGCAFS
jgi:hypothetical protein